MSAYRKFDVSAFLDGLGDEKIDVGKSAISANFAKGAQSGNVSSDLKLATPCYSVANFDPEGGGYRKFDPETASLGLGSDDESLVFAPTSNSVDYTAPDDREERAAIVEFDSRPSVDTSDDEIRESVPSRNPVAPVSPEALAQDWADAFGVPLEWTRGYSRICRALPPACIPAATWDKLIVGIAVILEQWGRKAHALGWSDLDLFGAHARAPTKRLDQAGLVWFIDDTTQLLALTATLARFRKPGGAVQSFQKPGTPEPGTVPVWELASMKTSKERKRT